jgi:uncharacterized protein (DUF2141 family)
MGSIAALALSLAMMLRDPGVAAHSALSASAKTSVKHFTLTIVAQGVSNSKGAVGALVFNSAVGWPEQVSNALKAKSSPAQPGVTKVVIPGLPPGDYAVVVLHDENGNKKLDRGLFGVPMEQWGMSNNPSYSLSAPSFDAARFRFADNERLYIQLH